MSKGSKPEKKARRRSMLVTRNYIQIELRRAIEYFYDRDDIATGNELARIGGLRSQCSPPKDPKHVLTLEEKRQILRLIEAVEERWAQTLRKILS